jgi:hypothetical protein
MGKKCPVTTLCCRERMQAGLRTKLSSPPHLPLLTPSFLLPLCQFPHQIIPDNEVRMIHWFSDEREFIIKIYIFQSLDMCSDS